MLAQRMDTSGNQWNIFEAPFGQPNPYAIRVGQDTLINGVEYHKLLRSINGEEPWTFNGALIREDRTQKVFYRNSFSEELIYDFNLVINDTAFFENENLAYPGSSEECFLTNVEETLTQRNIQIYPNPVSDELKITDEDQQLVSYNLLELTGKLIKGESINLTDQTITLEEVQPGMYLLMLRTKTGEKFARKILKQ